MSGFWCQGEEVPDSIWVFAVGLGIALLRADEIGKFHRVMHEKDRGISIQSGIDVTGRCYCSYTWLLIKFVGGGNFYSGVPYKLQSTLD